MLNTCIYHLCMKLLSLKYWQQWSNQSVWALRLFTFVFFPNTSGQLQACQIKTWHYMHLDRRPGVTSCDGVSLPCSIWKYRPTSLGQKYTTFFDREKEISSCIVFAKLQVGTNSLSICVTRFPTDNKVSLTAKSLKVEGFFKGLWWLSPQATKK